MAREAEDRFAGKLLDILYQAEFNVGARRYIAVPLMKGELQDVAELTENKGVLEPREVAQQIRFLSEMCNTMEASGVLKRVVYYPTGWQVRRLLKKSRSRFYHQSWDYQLYYYDTLDKVQLTRDLIRESAVRYR